FFSNRDYLMVVAMWVVAELLLFGKFGFYFQMEAEKYVSEANFILQNQHLSQGRYLFYLTTILIIALSISMKIGLYGAVFIIMTINLAGYLYFFKALKKVFYSRLPAFLVILFLLSFWPYQTWSLFLYTECLFYSLVMFLFSRLLLFEKMDLKFLGSTFLILALVIISRPLGILFVFPVLFFLYFHLTRRQKIFFFGVVILAFFLLGWVVQVVFTTTPDWNMQRAFLEENIICDMPVTVSNSQLELSDHPNQLYRLFFYVTHNFSHFSELALTRLKYFFLNTRPYYSSLHNAYLLISLFFIYACIMIGIRSIQRTFPTAILAFIFSVIFFFALAIAFQCDDYHNRFFLTLMPLLTVLAVAGATPLLKKAATFFSKPSIN
ncbi:MAG: hypothetical protein ACXWC7_18210, partial [Chitinophagaceae bacterium]